MKPLPTICREGSNTSHLQQGHVSVSTHGVQCKLKPEIPRNVLILKCEITQESVQHFGMETYRFVPRRTAFSSSDSSCFCPPGLDTCAPEGLFNVSACHGGSPMLLSWPHFYKADPQLMDNVEGLDPDKDKHEFHIDILPSLGTGLRAQIRLQINLHLE